MHLATIFSGLPILAMGSCGLAMNKTDKKEISYGLSYGLAMNKTDKKEITYELAMD